jgi:hypothetical protein
MKPNIGKTEVTSFSRKIKILIYDYKFCQSILNRTNSIKDLRMFIDTNHHFHNNVNHIFF